MSFLFGEFNRSVLEKIRKAKKGQKLPSYKILFAQYLMEQADRKIFAGDVDLDQCEVAKKIYLSSRNYSEAFECTKRIISWFQYLYFYSIIEGDEAKKQRAQKRLAELYQQSVIFFKRHFIGDKGFQRSIDFALAEAHIFSEDYEKAYELFIELSKAKEEFPDIAKVWRDFAYAMSKKDEKSVRSILAISKQYDSELFWLGLEGDHRYEMYQCMADYTLCIAWVAASFDPKNLQVEILDLINKREESERSFTDGRISNSDVSKIQPFTTVIRKNSSK